MDVREKFDKRFQFDNQLIAFFVYWNYRSIGEDCDRTVSCIVSSDMSGSDGSVCVSVTSVVSDKPGEADASGLHIGISENSGRYDCAIWGQHCLQFRFCHIWRQICDI